MEHLVYSTFWQRDNDWMSLLLLRCAIEKHELFLFRFRLAKFYFTLDFVAIFSIRFSYLKVAKRNHPNMSAVYPHNCWKIAPNLGLFLGIACVNLMWCKTRNKMKRREFATEWQTRKNHRNNSSNERSFWSFMPFPHRLMAFGMLYQLRSGNEQIRYYGPPTSHKDKLHVNYRV